MLQCKLCSELTVEKLFSICGVCSEMTFESDFSKVSSIVIVQGRLRSELTFEKLCVQCDDFGEVVLNLRCVQ